MPFKESYQENLVLVFVIGKHVDNGQKKKYLQPYIFGVACNTALVLGLSWQVAGARALLHLDLAWDHLEWDGELEWDWDDLGSGFGIGGRSPAKWKGPEAEAV